MTWWTPGCRSSSSLSLSAAAPAEPAAPSAPSAGGPSAAPRARPAPAASGKQRRHREGNLEMLPTPDERCWHMHSSRTASFKRRGCCGLSGVGANDTQVHLTSPALLPVQCWRERSLPLCEAGPVSAGWGWCSSWSQMTEGPASWAAPGSASAELAYRAQAQAKTFICCSPPPTQHK